MANFKSERFMSRVRPLMNLRPDRSSMRSFVRDLKHFFIDTWLDIVILIILGLITIGVWVAPHAFTRLFPITFFDHSGDIVWTQFAYPYVEPPLNSSAVALLCAFIPIATILIAQLWVGSLVDFGNAVLGLLYALITGTLFQVILKKTIGGLRPHFLTVCEPQLPQEPTVVGTGFQNVMFTIEQVCRGDKAKINNAIESFPSGHSQIAWAGLGYLAIYLFTHLRIQSQRRPSLWRMAMVLTPLLLASYVASSLVLSYNHHGYDVLAGGLIGSLVAAFAYRMVFMSIWDRRWNDVPRCRYIDPERRDSHDPETRRSSGDTIVNDKHVLPR